MYPTDRRPKLRAVMQRHVAGVHYIYLTTEKPAKNVASPSLPTFAGKCSKCKTFCSSRQWRSHLAVPIEASFDHVII